MKKGLYILSAVVLAVLMQVPALADQRGHGHGYQDSRYDQRGYHGGHHGSYDKNRNRGYNYRKPGYYPPGYRMSPRSRHYRGPYMYRGRSYRYDGHWHSYDAWARYRGVHPDWFRHGRYYREGGHLFFRFCDPAGGCFFFSIGR